jgi:hypothetical protein
MSCRVFLSSPSYLTSCFSSLHFRLFQFGLVIQSWQLPYVMMAFDCLIQRSLSSAWPHALGILSGHFYHFFTDIWPKLPGGKELLKMPPWFEGYINQFLPKQRHANAIDFRRGRRPPGGSGSGSGLEYGGSNNGSGSGGSGSNSGGGGDRFGAGAGAEGSTGAGGLNRYIDRKTLSTNRALARKANKGRKLGSDTSK